MSGIGSRWRRLIAAGATLALGGSLLVGCAGDGRETIRFTFSKREAIDFMTALVADYNASQDGVRVEIDTSGVDVVSDGTVSDGAASEDAVSGSGVFRGTADAADEWFMPPWSAYRRGIRHRAW